MLHSNAQATASRAGLTGIGRVHELDADAGSFCLVGDEFLQLSPGPAVQPGADTLAGHDSFADVSEILHGDRTAIVTCRFGDNGLADLLVDTAHMPASRPETLRSNCLALWEPLR